MCKSIFIKYIDQHLKMITKIKLAYFLKVEDKIFQLKNERLKL